MKKKKEREKEHFIYLIAQTSKRDMAGFAHHGFMSILIIYEKLKLRGPFHIKMCNNFYIFNINTQFWFHKSISTRNQI